MNVAPLRPEPWSAVLARLREAGVDVPAQPLPAGRPC